MRNLMNRIFSVCYAAPRPRRLDPLSVKRVLALRNDRLGDAILSTSVFLAIKDLNPEIELHVLGSQINSDFLSHQPCIDHVHRLYTKKARGLWRRTRNLSTLAKLRSISFDAVLDLVHDNRKDSNPFLVNLIARGALRSGYAKGGLPHQAFDQAVSSENVKKRHAVLEIQEILGNTFILPEGFEYPDPSVAREPEAAGRVQAVLQEAGIGRYAVINVAAGDPRREYPEARWGRVLQGVLPSRPGLFAVVTGPADQAERLESVCEAAGPELRGRCLAFPTTLYECSELLRGARAVLTPDTSVAHLAAAHKVPVLGLYDDFHYKDKVWRPFATACRLVYPPEQGLLPDIDETQLIQEFEALEKIAQ